MAARDSLAKYYGPTGYVSPERVRELNDVVTVSGVWLRREGGESASNSDAVVLVEIDGKWLEIIREGLFGSFSYCIGPEGIKSKASRS